jgi:hypothetical protein
MIIYSVLITSNYDGESLHLFTSLRDCVDFVKIKFEDCKDLHDLDFIDYDEMGCNYKNIKSSLSLFSNGYFWEGSIYKDYRTTIAIQKHDSSHKNMFNHRGEF